MENLVSSWSKASEILPKNYVLPAGERPGLVDVPLCQNIPIIDLSAGPSQIIQEILHASQEFGFFQVRLIDLQLIYIIIFRSF